MSIFQSFLVGFEGGQAQARQRRTDAARARAGSLMQSGDYSGAQSALMADPDTSLGEVAAVGELGDQARSRTARESVRNAMSSAGEDPLARLRAGTGAALESGEFDLAAQLQGLSHEELNQTRENARIAAGVMSSLVELPAEQRQAAALRIAQSPHGALFGITPEQIQGMSPEDFSDASLEQTANMYLDIEHQASMRYQRERDVVEDARWEREYQQNEREMQLRHRATRAASNGDRRQLRNDYSRALRPLEELRDGMSLIGDYAQGVVEAGPTNNVENIDRETVRVRDGALLMQAARMVQGAGILSDQDVAMIQGSGLDGFIANAAGYVTGSQQLSDRQRYALADLVMRRRSSIDEAIRETYEEHAAFAESMDVTPEQAGIHLPGYLRRQRGGGSGNESRQPSTVERVSGRAAQGGLRIGQIVDGRQYRGGDPDDEESWRDPVREREAPRAVPRGSSGGVM